MAERPLRFDWNAAIKALKHGIPSHKEIEPRLAALRSEEYSRALGIRDPMKAMG